jgi:hypothetical protein
MVDMSKGSRFIFVGGAPRSGTTLMQNMLDSHPNILGGPEFIHIPDIVHLRNKLHHSIAIEWIDHFCSYDDVDRYICSLIESFLLPLADKYGNKFLSEKTPGNVLVFSELISLFPDSHFIHVVRDPRAVVASLLQVGMRAKKKGIETAAFTGSLEAAIDYSRKCMMAGFTASKIAPEKVLTVVYERLVLNPESETKNICTFLGVDWSSQMINPGSFRHLGEKAITAKSDEIWYDTTMYNSNPEAHHIDKWKTLLTPTQRVRIAKSFRDCEELVKLGYDFAINGLPKVNYVTGLTYSTFFPLIDKALNSIQSFAFKIASIRRLL